MSRGAHLAAGILVLWIACVLFYVAFTMGHTPASQGYFTQMEQELASHLQGQGGTTATDQTAAVTTATSAQALGLTEGGGV